MNTTCRLMMTGALLCVTALPAAAQDGSAGRDYPASVLGAPVGAGSAREAATLEAVFADSSPITDQDTA